MERATRRSRPERWVVQLGPGSLCVLTSAQLDDAYRRGLVDEATLVLPDGGRQWMTLGERNALRTTGNSAYEN
jgi:hypothetical protein